MNLIARLLQIAGIAVLSASFAGGVAMLTSASSGPAPAVSPSPAISTSPSAAPIAAAPAPGTLAPGSTAKNPIIYGDLSHLQYTATGALSASFVFPSDGFASPTIAVRFVLATVRDAGVELAVDGEVVPSTKIGKRVVAVKSGETRYEYYGVLLKPGPNAVTITPLGANGSRGPAQRATIYGPGAPAALSAKMANTLIADGRTSQMLEVAALDRWGHAAQPGSEVHVTLAGGDVRFVNSVQKIDPLAAASAPPVVPTPFASPSPGTTSVNPSDPNAVTDPARIADVTLEAGGIAKIAVLPGMLAGDVRVQLTSGDVLQSESFFVEPYLRKAFVNGLVTVGAGAVPADVDGDGNMDNGDARRARVALFATGAVSKHTSVTLAYESQNPLTPLSSFGPFIQDPNERPYLTYGDASLLSDDLRSNDRLFARVDSGRASLMWGQFQADINDPSSLGSFHQLLGGAKAEYSTPSGRAKITAFTAHNTTAYMSYAVPASGLSTLAQPLRANIVVGSDYITLVALDRRTGAVLSQTPLMRNVDYTIDYATGVLRFINVPLPFDLHFNPQVVLIQYAYQGISTNSQVTGGSMRFDFGPKGSTELQLGYVNDATGSSNFSVFSQSITGRVSGGVWSFSHASSRGTVPGQLNAGLPVIGNGALSTGAAGDAYAFAYSQRVGFDQFTANFASTTAGFANPFGGLSVPGFLTYRASWTHANPSRSDVTLEVDGQQNHGIGVDDSQRNASLTYRRAIGSAMTLMLGVSARSQNNVTPNAFSPFGPLPVGPTPVPGASPVPAATYAPQSGTVMQATAGLDLKATSRLSLTVQKTMTLSGNDAQTSQPAQTTAQLTYDLGKAGRAFVRELISDSATSSFAQATSNLTVGALATRSTQIGFERNIGPNTTVDTEYMINGTGSGTDIYSAIGVQQKFKLGPHLAGNAFVQSANATGPGASGFTVSGLTLDYAGSDNFRAAFGVQARGGYGGGSTISGGVAGRLSPSLSLIGTINDTRAAGASAADDRISLAYRSADDDRFISLFGLEREIGFGATAAGVQTNVLSFEQFWRPSPQWEYAGRFAYKLDGDAIYGAHTGLAGFRFRRYVGRRFDLGSEFRVVAIPGIGGSRSSDFAVEGGYAIGNGTRAAVGYTFNGSIDPALTGQPTKRGFYFTMTTMIDRLFGWGKDSH